MQLHHDQHIINTHQKEIILICDHISSPANQGALFRLADAFGVREILFVGSEPDLKSSRLKKTARNTHNTVPYSYFEAEQELLNYLKDLEYNLIALEITNDSKPITQIDMKQKKLAILLGNEQHGVQNIFLSKANEVAHIPMFGSNSSMNVAQAAAIALFELTR